MGKRSRERNTGLTQEQRVKRGIEEKARREKEQRQREAEVLRYLLQTRIKQREEEEKRRWMRVPE